MTGTKTNSGEKKNQISNTSCYPQDISSGKQDQGPVYIFVFTGTNGILRKASWEDGLLHTHESLSLDPQDTHQFLGTAVFCKPSAGKAEPGESLELTGQSAQLSKGAPHSVRDLASKL